MSKILTWVHLGVLIFDVVVFTSLPKTVFASFIEFTKIWVVVLLTVVHIYTLTPPSPLVAELRMTKFTLLVRIVEFAPLI